LNHLYHRVVVVFCTLLIIDGLSSFAIAQTGCGSVIRDIDGNTYKTVQIGTQCWMAENLKTSKYRDGTPIPNVQDGSRWSSLNNGAWAYYNNEAKNNSTHGKLYNWYVGSDERGVCPVGWRIANTADWSTLRAFLGENHGRLLKSRAGWLNGGNGVDSVRFNALPSGGRSRDGHFYSQGSFGIWWGAYRNDREWATPYYLTNNDNVMGTSHDNELHGFSIRCVKE